ncbi:MAG: hypothetical protein K8I30_12505 [Anaerolineae bacterium]|nr:hypothetical protein [Anaerolineae bacterium]
MKVQRRTNLLWGLVFLASAILVLLGALGVLPLGIADLIGRAWPILLVLGGLSIFLRDRVPFGGFFALLICTALVAGVTIAAFSNRTTQERSDYQEAIAQTIGAGTNLLRAQVITLASDVELVRALDPGQASGQFTGSTESKVEVNYIEAADNTATLTVTETHPNQIPVLEAVGRGRLTLEFPSGVPLDVDFRALDGVVSLNMSGLSVERLNLDLQKGDALVTLPAYKPLGSPAESILGALAVRDGDITVYVPPGVAVRFELNRGGSGQEPVYDAALYNYLVGDILEARNFDSADIKLRYQITAPRGLVTIASAGS